MLCLNHVRTLVVFKHSLNVKCDLFFASRLITLVFCFHRNIFHTTAFKSKIVLTDLIYIHTFTGIPIQEFVGLRPKMYSLIYVVNGSQHEKRTAKGIAKSAMDKQIRHLNYKQCLLKNKLTMNDMNLIRSDNHILFINNVRKNGLCNFDDKRFWKNSVQSYAYGHYKIPFIQKCCNVYC